MKIILDDAITQPIFAELAEVKDILTVTTNPEERQRLRNRIGELTQQYWKLVRQGNRENEL